METAHTDLSVIIPVCNEKEVLPHLHKRLIEVLDKLGLAYEAVFVNDGSSDGSFDILQGFAKENSRIKILSFSRNFGHQAAITAGLNFSRAKAVVVMDADLQDPPELIPAFLEKWRTGFEVVYGVHAKRKENILKQAVYKIYYRLLSRLSDINIPLDSGDFCLMDRRVVDLLNSIPERNRFIRGLRSWVGFRQAGIEYERDRRFCGKPKYTFLKLLKLGLDGIISFSGIPLKIVLVSGFFISFSSVIYSLYIIYNRIFNTANQIPGWTSIIVGVSFLGGIQLMVMGLLGEYVIRIFDEVKRRPMYVLNAAIGFHDKDAKGISNNPGA